MSRRGHHTRGAISHRIDHWKDIRGRGFFKRIETVVPGDNDVHPPGKISRCIGQRLWLVRRFRCGVVDCEPICAAQDSNDTYVQKLEGGKNGLRSRSPEVRDPVRIAPPERTANGGQLLPSAVVDAGFASRAPAE